MALAGDSDESASGFDIRQANNESSEVLTLSSLVEGLQ